MAAKDIHFNKAAFDELITFVDGVEQEINDKFLKATANLSFDGDLGVWLKPGTSQWGPVEMMKGRANTFGESVHTKFTGLSDDWRAYGRALIAAKEVFEKTDDLATMSATEFLDEYPDMAPGTTGTGGV